MSNMELSLQGVGKAFRKYSNEWKRFASWTGLEFGFSEETWVLRNISFSVNKSETVGIIGQNGAGKSTLLKIVAGITRPTEGKVNMNGRVAAIIELGTGFNPELSGRQNTIHGLGLMGFSSADIERVMPKLEAFIEIGEYFDQPTRTYSTGMQMRVAFAVATAFRPEILIIDEALAVGDSYFQHKSFNRIREFQQQGTTLLFVSHDRNAIQTLCDRAILLENGTLIKDGNPEEVMDFYNAIVAEKEDATIRVTQVKNGKSQTTSGTGEAQVQDIQLLNANGDPKEFIKVGEPVILQIKVLVKHGLPILVLGYMIKDRLGQAMYGTNTWHTEQILKDLKAGQEIIYRIKFPMNFGPGSYSVSTALASSDTHLENNYEWRDLALVFNVTNIDKIHFVGCAWNEPIIEIKLI